MKTLKSFKIEWNSYFNDISLYEPYYYGPGWEVIDYFSTTEKVWQYLLDNNFIDKLPYEN